MLKCLLSLSGLRKSLAGLRSHTLNCFTVGTVALAAQIVTGCGNGLHLLAPVADAASLFGYVRGGGEPVNGSHLELYAAGNGNGAANTPLLSQPVTTSANGGFSIAGLYTCPSASSQMYLVATGGSADQTKSASNPAAVMMAALGRCDGLADLAGVDVDELTTVAAISTLAPYMQSVSSIGTGTENAQALADAFTAASELVTLVKQTTPDSSLANDPYSPIEKTAALANILSTCNSASGDKTCGTVLSYAAQSNATPKDTASAMLQIANNPTHNVVPLFSLHPGAGSFQPSLSTAPANWTIATQTKVPSPTFSPAPGAYSGPVTLTLKDTAPGARLYYNTGDGWASYTGPITLPATAKVTALAILNGMSLFATGTYTIAPQQTSISQSANATGAAAVSAAAVSSTRLPVSAASQAAATTAALPTVNYANGFTASGLTLNGGATLVGNALQLTDGGNMEGTSAWFNAPVDVRAFTADFTFQQTAALADGFTFTLQNSPAGTQALGGFGIDLGYGGIPSSVAVKFDIYNNSGEGTDATGIYLNGARPTMPSQDMTASGINLRAGNLMHATISYDGTTLTLTLTDTVTNKVYTSSSAINIPAAIGGNTAYAGFTGGSGGLSSVQKILSWSYVVNTPKTTVNYTNGFTASGLTLNGGATLVGNALQLTDGGNMEGTSAWFNAPVDVRAFTADFTFQQTAALADGFTFTLQNSPAGTQALGGFGIDLGYGGIPSSVAVKFDIYNNSGEGTDATGIYLNGARPTMPSQDMTASGINLRAGNLMHATISYDGTTLTLTLTDTVTNKVYTSSSAINIPAAIGGNTAYAGFTGGSGGLSSVQKILSWSYTSALSVTPNSGSLLPSQTLQFTAAIGSTPSTAVTWSLSPAIGSISSTGLYTAPSTTAAPQTVTVIATLKSDPTQTATASIAVVSPVSITLTPGGVTLMPSTSQQFSAAVMGSTNTAVTWTLNPAVGSISPSGLYTAPASVAATQTVTVTATSAADTTKTASAGITLNPAVPSQLQFVAQPSDASTRGVIPSTITVAVEDTNGNVMANASNPVTLTLTGSNALTGTLTAVPVNGIATFTNLTVGAVGSYTLTASSPALTSAASTSFNVTLLDPGFSGPIVITQGGTYSGKWESLDPTIVAVRVVTDQPVVIQNSVVKGASQLIVGNGGGQGLHLQINNVAGQALNANVLGQGNGIFLYAENVTSLDVTNSSMTNVSSGIFVAGGTTTHLRVVNNTATNMNDWASDGNGGYQVNRATYGHFIVFNGVTAPNGAEVGWNQVLNTVGQASVEDVISMYNSRGGSVSAPINIHDNYIHGAITTPGLAYSGTGMIIDGDQTSANIESAYILIQNNQVVMTQNGGISVPTGHDITVINNRLVSSGQDGNGHWLVPSDNYGYGYCLTSNQPSQFFNNTFNNNYGGMVRQNWVGVGYRVDTLLTATSSTQNDTAQNFNLIGPVTDATVITPATEAAEYVLWTAKVAAAQQNLGASSSVLAFIKH